MTQAIDRPTARPVTPIGILTAQLESLLHIATRSQFDPAFVTELQVAYQLAAGLDPYLNRCTTSESEPLAYLAQQTAQEAWQQRFSEGATVRPLEQEMLSGHVEGQTLKLFIQMMRAKRVLEVGMFTGYSALAMAEAVPDDGEVVACEIDPYAAEFAQSAFARSPHGKKIRVEVGPALETLDRLAAESPFDFVFIDADKREYVTYFQRLLEQNLLSPNGVICVDNTLFQGQAYLPELQTANGKVIAHFNEVVAADPRVEQVLLPLRDGLTLIRRIS